MVIMFGLVDALKIKKRKWKFLKMVRILAYHKNDLNIIANKQNVWKLLSALDCANVYALGHPPLTNYN